MKNIKNIIFDYGNVIFNISFEKAQQAWTALGISNAADFFGHRQQDPVFDAFDRGEITPQAFRDRIRELTGNPELTDEQINTAWNSMLLGINEGTHELLLQIKEKYRTFLLSNINAIHYDHIMEYLNKQFGIAGNDHLFEKTYYSHFTGKRKPEPAIFEQVLTENNLKPEETLFIDDSPQHLAAAEALGIHTFLMKAPDTLQAYFSRNGLL
ncbi:HAD family phosphatase [Mucilaginibacter limnophilus]|uniref:HAD family phosphatase n=1 Tax=Mucilaginibacter limnophilus TaxID=1932778 RepID=A0A3S2V3P9_9SPHI|nr:HAD family phosphatase [Mucilaginibacter limnophilus]RVU02570.1 HAD family phosphatase [Mucilaginibacter limnophilus]